MDFCILINISVQKKWMKILHKNVLLSSAFLTNFTQNRHKVNTIVCCGVSKD